MVLSGELAVDIGNSAVVVLAYTFALDYAGMQHSDDDTCLDNSGNCSMGVPCRRREAVEIVVAEGQERACHRQVDSVAAVAVAAAIVVIDLFI